MNKKKAVIIGSGFGGLAMGIRLQAMGFDTEIYEKNEMIGGHAYQLKKNGYTFDMGPSIITVPFIIEELFSLNSEKSSDYFNLIPVDPYYRVYFHDKTYIDYSGDGNKMKAQLSKFNKSDAKNYDKFQKLSKGIYKAVILDGLGGRPFSDFKSFISFAPKALKLKAIFPGHFLVSRYFKDFRSRFLFSFHPLFIGGSPFNTPSIFLMLPYLEKHAGVWFTKGGMYTVVTELGKLYERMGGKIFTNQEVKKIIVKDQKAIGIKTDKKEVSADLVVSNAHFANTYMDLISHKERKKWTDKKVKSMDYSMGCYLLFLGVKKKYPELKHHTLILSERYKGLVKDLFGEKILPNDFSMYLHAPSKSDPSMAPNGCESMYVLVPTPNLKANVDWKTHGEIYAEKIINFLEKDFGLKDLKQNIEVKEIFTSLDFEKIRNNYLGAPWSLQPKLTQIASFRPHNRSEEIKNLYLVGASTHPGGGVPGVLLSAKATELVIKEDFNVGEN